MKAQLEGLKSLLAERTDEVQRLHVMLQQEKHTSNMQAAELQSQVRP